ncbi:MAG: glycosyltransferase family 2 protein [Wenzhouxiangella sp.]|nr:MAG: glycosyltransferase family 2 protein [Wenzhouxiangella sp.]
MTMAKAEMAEAEIAKADKGVSLIIPNWNGAHHLVECLDSLKPQCGAEVEVVVVDNASSDDSIRLLEEQYPWVRLIRLDDNLGFSAAVNAGIRATSAPLIVLLNNDTRAAPDWLEKLVNGLLARPEASFAACKMLLFDPPHAIDSAGDRFSLLTGTGINIGAGEPAEACADPAWVFGACAGAAIYRRSLFDDIGLFDEDFFLVFEDVDLDMRAQVAGHRCLYLPDAVVYHKRGASTDNSSRQVAARSWRNLIWVAGKNLPPLLLTWWSLVFTAKLVRMVLVSVAARLWRRLTGRIDKPDSEREQPAAAPAPTWQQGALAAHYWPEFRRGLRLLPAKRRQTRPLRRLGSLGLLPVLLKPVRPLK